MMAKIGEYEKTLSWKKEVTLLRATGRIAY